MQKRNRLKHIFTVLTMCSVPFGAMAESVQQQEHPLADSGDGDLHQVYALATFYTEISTLRAIHGNDFTAKSMVSALTGPDRSEVFNEYFIFRQSKEHLRKFYDVTDMDVYMVVCSNSPSEYLIASADTIQRSVWGKSLLDASQLATVLRDMMRLPAGPYLQLRAAEAAQRKQGLNPDDAFCKKDHGRNNVLGLHQGR